MTLRGKEGRSQSHCPIQFRPKYQYSLLAPRIVAHVFANVVAGHRQHQRILGRIKQMDENAQQVVVLFVEAQRILAPEFRRFVHRRPFQAAAADLRGVLVERAQVLHGVLQLGDEELHIAADVLVVVFALLENGQLLQHLALHHGDAMLLGHLDVLRLLDQIAEHGQNDARHLLLGRIVEDVGNDRDHIEFVHLLGQQRIEGQHPQAEDQLVLDLSGAVAVLDLFFNSLEDTPKS